MQQRRHSLALVVLTGCLLAPAAFAQGGPGIADKTPIGPGGGMNDMLRNSPFVMGRVEAVDPGAGTISVSSGGGTRLVKVTADTQVVSQVATTVGDLKVGDHVQVTGVPTGLRASQITAGDAPELFGRPMPPRPAVPLRGDAFPGGVASGGPLPRMPFGLTTQATGQVTSTQPLTISVSDEVSLTLKLASGAKISRIMPVTLSKIKVGDRLMASGQSGDDGSLAAATVALNLDGGDMGPIAPRMPGMAGPMPGVAGPGARGPGVGLPSQAGGPAGPSGGPNATGGGPAPSAGGTAAVAPAPMPVEVMPVPSSVP